MSDPPSRLARVWSATVFVASRLGNALGAAVFFGQWGFGVGLLLGLIVGGLMHFLKADAGMVLLSGGIVGAGVGIGCGALFGLFVGGSSPEFADRLAKHPLFWRAGKD